MGLQQNDVRWSSCLRAMKGIYGRPLPAETWTPREEPFVVPLRPLVGILRVGHHNSP
jgi:hypothetical protein